MNVRDLMRLHVEALFTHDANNRLLRGNEPSGAEAPRFFLGRTADGPVIRFRHDLDDDTRHELEAAALESEANVARFEEILARSAPVRNTWLGPAFSFPESSFLIPFTADLSSARLLVGFLVTSSTLLPKATMLESSGSSSCFLKALLPAASMIPSSS